MSQTEAGLPPFDETAEKSLLGSVLIRPKLFPDLANDVAVDDFFKPAHRMIWSAMGAVARRGLTIDPVTLGDEIRLAGEVKRLEGGEGYIVDLAGCVPSAERAGEYASLVSERAASRRVITLCAEATSRARGSSRAPEIIETLTRELAKVVVHAPEEMTTAADLFQPFLDELEARAASGQAIRGIRTGVDALDRVTFGFDPEDLVVIAGDPGGGKTALAVQIALLLALTEDGAACVCSLEMSKPQITERLVAYLGGVDSEDLRAGRLTRGQWASVYGEPRERLQNGGGGDRLVIEDKALTMPQIVSRARAWRTRFPKHRGVLVVDYLQRIRGGKGDNRAGQIGEWTNALKDLARSLKITVLLLSQLNRAPSKDKRPPTMRDLRESGDIEADADTIVLIHNASKIENGDVQLILDKNRKGKCRSITAHWTACHYSFSDDPKHVHEQQPLPGAA